MRIPALILAVLIGLFLGRGVAAAEKVKTNQPTKLFNRPGEQAKVLLNVKSGVSMTLLAKDGRWLKVRVKGRTGYVPRSKVDMADDEDIARNTRRRPFVDGRGKKRGDSDGAPDDRVGADALGDNDAGDSGASSDDEEDEKPARTTKTAKASSKAKAREDEDGDDDEEDEKPAKAKVAAKTPPKTPPKAATKASSDDDDDGDGDGDEEDDKPAAKPAAKTKVAAATTASSDDDDDGDGDGDGDGDDDDAEVPKKDCKDCRGPGIEDEEKEAKDSRPRGRVTKRVSVYTDPDDESDEDFVARPTDTLFLGETKGTWTYVETSSGEGGWVQSDLLETEDGGAGGGGKQIAVRARGGVLLVKQGIRSTASSVQTPPDNYDVKARMLAVNLGGGILLPKGKFLVGGELAYDLAKGSVPYEGAGDTSLTLHNVNVRLLGGIDFRKPNGMTLVGHLGYRYQAILVADVADTMANPARLPSEVVKGPTLGAELGIARLTNKLGLNVSLDAMLFGAGITQTKGLEDGGSPSIKAIVLGAGLAYHLRSLDVLARYELDYMGIDFGAPLASSTRMHMGTDVKRTDVFHGISVGVSKPF